MSENNKEYLNNLRHSCAHLLAKSVKELYPGAHNAIGPSIENGFYQDFDMGNYKISDEDLPKIEKKMREIVPTWKHFEFSEVSLDEAKKLFADNPYKVEMAEEFATGGKKLQTNDPGNFLDLCKMGHVENPSNELKHFKLLKIAGAYWRGSEKNKMLTRIYGTVFPTKEELEKYLWQQEEAKKRDHKKLGRELELFLNSSQVGPGLPILMPKGARLRKIIEEYLIDLKEKNGYQFVWSPHIARSEIYHISKHWGKYDAMFQPMKLDEEEYVLKPMNCPHHFQVYLERPRSYKELPFRIAENGTVYRNEKSGEVNGLLRVRALTIDDTHTFIRPQDTFDELNSVLSLIKKIFEDFGFNDYYARISTRDPKQPDKYLGDPQAWEKAEESLKKAASHLEISHKIGEGEAAFYGPKIDLMVKDSIGREWQLSTVQLDYNQPKNFQMKYIDESGKEVEPAILHIAMVGSLERLMGILIEHYAGKFPLWLAPVQIVLIPIADRHNEAVEKIAQSLKNEGIRVEVDKRSGSMQGKIRDHTLQKVPYLGIIGDKEVEAGSISIRSQDGRNLGSMTVSDFIRDRKKEIEKKH